MPFLRPRIRPCWPRIFLVLKRLRTFWRTKEHKTKRQKETKIINKCQGRKIMVIKAKLRDFRKLKKNEYEAKFRWKSAIFSQKRKK